MADQPEQHADYEREWKTTAIGLSEENELLVVALASLWEWAVPQGIERHAEDGDSIAAAIVALVRGVLEGPVCDPECRDPQSECHCDPVLIDGPGCGS